MYKRTSKCLIPTIRVLIINFRLLLQREIHRYESAQYRRGKLERQKKLYTENSD